MKVWGEFVVPRKSITRAPATSKIRYFETTVSDKKSLITAQFVRDLNTCLVTERN